MFFTGILGGVDSIHRVEMKNPRLHINPLLADRAADVPGGPDRVRSYLDPRRPSEPAAGESPRGVRRRGDVPHTAAA